jgi:hypothetical protein
MIKPQETSAYGHSRDQTLIYWCYTLKGLFIAIILMYIHLLVTFKYALQG